MTKFQPESYVEQTLSNWQYKESGEEAWSSSRPVEATEIYADLLHNKVIPDPFVDLNEKEVQWVAEKDWEYKTSFTVGSDAGSMNTQELVFEGLDTFATVYLNEKKILETDNMFRTYKVDVKDKIEFGKSNSLRIYFKSALREGRRLEKEIGRLVCFNGETSRLHVRKSQYHYGWDWGPVLMTCGPWKPVKLLSYNSEVQDVYVKTEVRDDLSVLVDVITDVICGSSTSLKVEISDPKGKTLKIFEHEVESSDTISHKLELDSPQLWYPLGSGEQPLYNFTITLGSQKITKKVGLRKVELIQEPLVDQEGTSFYFKVNNIPVYSTGSNWIPAHSLLTLLTNEDYSKWLQLMVDGNQNMVRVWAGGIYETDFFYEECDRLGLLVWQDFMFACGQYPGYPQFLENVAAEAKDQLKRLRNHCSIALYAGNNEDYQVAESFGLEWDVNDISGDYSKTSFPARTIYETVLPKLVKAYSSDVPYHPGSPWGGNGTADTTIGDIHQWNVWHGSQEKYQDWYKLGGRFVSEFGMEALPSLKTYQACITDSSELYPQSEMVDHHNKADGFERRLALYVIENIKVKSFDLDSWIYATQLMQSECLGYAYRCWRRQWKGEGQRYSGGAIVWQINDCWPVASWALVDFYRRPKLAFYSVKRESRTVGVGMYRIEEKHTPEQAKAVSEAGPPHDYSKADLFVDIWGVNSSVVDIPATLKVDIYNVTSGEKVESLDDRAIVLKQNQTTELVSRHSLEYDFPVVVYSRFVSEDGSILGSAADWPQPLKYLKFNDRKVSFKVEENRIVLSANKPVKGVEVILSNDLFLEDNGFDIFPGDDKVVGVQGIRKEDVRCIRYYGE
ncbi:Beta-mannosidase B [Meyerozyma sp. JA9]|nr:Beta-mannosidase B [Meyerozyma sp. JA9]